LERRARRGVESRIVTLRLKCERTLYEHTRRTRVGDCAASAARTERDACDHERQKWTKALD
jgi:phosphate uptake regulator